MARSTISVAHETDDFQETLGELGVNNVVVTQPGQLRARMTYFVLKHLRLVTVEENLPRIAFIHIPDNAVLLSFLLAGQTVPVWAGCKIAADEVIVIRGGEYLHARTDGAIHWAAIQFPLQEFMRFRRAVTGETSRLPGAICVWRSSSSARSTLLQLLAAAVSAVQTRWVALTADQAVHGLEQQLIHGSLRCITGAPVTVEMATAHRNRELAARFEALLQGQQEGNPCAANFARALGVSERVLRKCCRLQFGVAPMHYVRLRRMQLVNRALRSGAAQTLRVSDLAERFGFHNPGRFAKAYKELFGELPSSTLRGGRRRNRATQVSGLQPCAD